MEDRVLDMTDLSKEAYDAISNGFRLYLDNGNKRKRYFGYVDKMDLKHLNRYFGYTDGKSYLKGVCFGASLTIVGFISLIEAAKKNKKDKEETK